MTENDLQSVVGAQVALARAINNESMVITKGLVMKRHVLSAVVVLGLSVASLSAFASVGAVKVDTFGNLGLQLGTICDSYLTGSHPIGIACEIVADPGSGTVLGCGTGTCTNFGSIVRGDSVGAYCQDTNGNDAVVFCTSSNTPGPLSPAGAAEEQKGK